MSRSLDAWLDWAENQCGKTIRLGLDAMNQALDALSLPPPARQIITVAGTNGKGSTVAYIEAMGQAHGLRMGSYTSPHLLHYRERFRVLGHHPSDEELCRAFEQIEAQVGHSLSYFEISTLIALLLMASSDLDLAVLEVGMGGRLDAVNALDADVAVITSIAMDHTQYLGDDLAAIAREKAGIVRAGRPAVLGMTQAPRGLREFVEDHKALPLQSGREYFWDKGKSGASWQLRLPDDETFQLDTPKMPGEHQLANAAAALVALHAAGHRLAPDPINLGLRRTSVSGRMQLLQNQPRVLVDVAHNEAAVQAVAAQLRSQPISGRTLVVVAMLADKDHRGALAPLNDLAWAWYLAPTQGERGCSADLLAQALPDHPRVHQFTSVANALAAALESSDDADQILIIGGFQTAEHALRFFTDG